MLETKRHPIARKMKQSTRLILRIFSSLIVAIFIMLLANIMPSLALSITTATLDLEKLTSTSLFTPSVVSPDNTLVPTPIITRTTFPTETIVTITPTPAFPTFTPTITNTVIPTLTRSPNLDNSQSSTNTTPTLYMPVIYRYSGPIPPTKMLFCDSLTLPRTIPDNSPNGINDYIVINDPGHIYDIELSVDINHSWVGDLKVQLTHEESSTNVMLINRPGYPANQYGCEYDNIRTILSDKMSSSVENKCASTPAAISGMYLPQNPLNAFVDKNISGTWTITVSDHYPNDIGTLREWCIIASVSENPPPPPPDPIIPPLPSQAIINGVTGKDQSLPLDCESRSAVDWAKFFGYNIGEIAFYNNLPISDNPDKGFVGNVNGRWGQIPPNDYGVHAEPVANLLRQYGVQAYAHHRLSWPELKAEIAAGRPVFVWIVGSVDNGIPELYTPLDGLHTVVARYEHTVIVTGYTQSRVYYLNGDTIYFKTITQFLDSWSALGNMAITTQP